MAVIQNDNSQMPLSYIQIYYMKKVKLILISMFFASAINAQNIIPKPVSYSSTDEIFLMDGNLDIVIPQSSETIRTYVNNFIDFLGVNGKDINILHQRQDRRAIVISLKNIASLGKEGYTLEIKEEIINLSANAEEGVFNGLQTIRQLLPADMEGPESSYIIAKLQGCKIIDYPRFAWRGLMLDVSRHFFTVEEVKQFIDKMSQYKFNVFHWHLTDDEGWRIEIKSLPKLTEVGAWRAEGFGRFGHGRTLAKQGDKTPYGGFYTQEEVRDIVSFAAERNITIVPEIDMPGHSIATLAAYPELSVNKEPKMVSNGAAFVDWYGEGKFKMLIENTLNPTDEKVYEFVDKVMTEVAELFPGEYIHMGGDEAYHGYWAKNRRVQRFMKKNKLKDTQELQAYFVRRVNDIINSKGKKMIGWDEILDGGGLPKSTSVMSWRGMSGGITAAQAGHYVVMSPKFQTYLDYTQGDFSVENRIHGSLSLEETYNFEPIPENVDSKYILGGQANLWTETVPTMPFAFYMSYPRALAIAEKVWSPKNISNFDEFVERVEHEFERFDKAGISISKTIYEPVVTVTKRDNKYFVELKTPINDAEVYYSIDNTYPVRFARKYTGPIAIPEGQLSLRTQTYRNGKELGREIIIPYEELIKRVK